MLSPVDGADPWGLIDNFIVPDDGSGLQLQAPSLIMMAGLDSVPGERINAFLKGADTHSTLERML